MDPFLAWTLNSFAQQHLTTQKRTTDRKAILLLYFSIIAILKKSPKSTNFPFTLSKILICTSGSDDHVPESNYLGELNCRLSEPSSYF